jgi:hypothetical protein
MILLFILLRNLVEKGNQNEFGPKYQNPATMTQVAH